MKNSSHCIFIGTLLWVAAAVWAGPTLAAGGAHVVDDSEVETPGTCHVELWVAEFVPGDGYANVAPACTTLEIPWLEIGAAYAHCWDQTVSGPLIGPQLKINFRPASKGVGFGPGLSAAVNTRTGEVGLAGLIGLVTIPVPENSGSTSTADGATWTATLPPRSSGAARSRSTSAGTSPS